MGDVCRRALAGFQGRHSTWGVSGLAYRCVVLTLAVNTWILSGGLRRGIERAASWGMPVLIGLSVLLTVRGLTLGAPAPGPPAHHVWNGLGFLWTPERSSWTDARGWLAAAGHIVVPWSVGVGPIQV